MLDKLTAEAYLGRTHLWIWRYLTNALIEKPDVAESARVFFTLTLRSHMDEAFLHLSRLFDPKRGTLSLRMLLQCAETNAGMFEKADAASVRSALVPKLRLSLEKMGKQVRPVLNRRNKILAHLDPRTATDFAAVAKDSAITLGEMESLYANSGDMVNEISNLYRGSSNAMEIIGWDDFRRMVELMDRGRKADLDELEGKYGGV